MGASLRSLRALDWVNLLMADVKDGVGVYLSVYLLTVRHWDAAEIGLAISLPGFIGILVQSPAGALIDSTRYKLLLVVAASVIIAACCLTVVLSEEGIYIFASQVFLGISQSVYAPAVAAITLGMVGRQMLSGRIGRNESFNHLGNMLAAIIAGMIGFYISYEGIFYFSILQCFIIIAATLCIKENDIDHVLARAAKEKPDRTVTVSKTRQLFTDRKILLFTLSMCLLHLANGAMLPLLGQKIGITDVTRSALYLSVCIVIAQAVMVFVAPVAARRADKGRKKIFLFALLLIPVRAILFAYIENPYLLTSLQVLDGLAAGIFGVVSILMMADLSKDTGHFNLLQGIVYSAMGLGGALSSALAGLIVKYYGYEMGFYFLAVLGIFSFLFFMSFVRDTKAPEQKPGAETYPSVVRKTIS